MREEYRMATSPKADAGCIVQGEKFRISVLTERLIRLEYQKDGIFEDRATQRVVNRQFAVPQFKVNETSEQIEIITEYLHVVYDKQSFSKSGLSIRMSRYAFSNHSIWHYGDNAENLLGTARTLDEANGAIPLEDGLLGRLGYAVLDDSRALVLQEDGWVCPPLEDHMDIYFFGYGHNYKECLKDFFRLCGKTPMLPRYALGNWWSRYHAYTQEEYMDLMKRFEQEQIPFAVAVIDMDWHYVKLEEKYGNGWTGYTWNEELFPDHKNMLSELHEKGMHVTLNVHPAEGVRGHEKAYVPMAKALGADYEKEAPIPFDIADPEFLDAYFKYLHHPLEEEGVDFWWIDWQQGFTTKIPGLDPLWMLNHYHFLDNGKGKKRPMIFSRYAGLGSHRYPVGFSGDTVITWESLKFQPYFTSTASNAGYGWWSHDIGGHMNGYRDDELAVRWVQYGVFSPIMRLHSSNSRFTGKEPWNFPTAEHAVMNTFLQLRHQLIPYLYTMNRRFHKEGEPLIQPMYYDYPDSWDAYDVPNQYMFGSELMVHPITSKMDMEVKAGSAVTWLPEGTWYDMFTGLRYRGGKTMELFRTLETIPVLAKAGAIVPLQKLEEVSAKTENPSSLELLVFAGADGAFTLYEDDGIGMGFENGSYAETEYIWQWEQERRFTIEPVSGDVTVVPEYRNYTLKFYGVLPNQPVCVKKDGAECEFTERYEEAQQIQVIELKHIGLKEKITIEFPKDAELAENNPSGFIFEILRRSQIENWKKEKLYGIVTQDSLDKIISGLNAVDISAKLRNSILEILLA